MAGALHGGALMLLGRVIGQVVPAIIYDGLSGVPMLIVQPLDKKLQPRGKTLVAADATRMAGPGELVSYEGGREAALALDTTFVPVDHAIIAIVDGVNVE
jgi:ethanolamine utilization protein EutN